MYGDADKLDGTRQRWQQPTDGESPATWQQRGPRYPPVQRTAGEKGSSRAFGGAKHQQ